MYAQLSKTDLQIDPAVLSYIDQAIKAKLSAPPDTAEARVETASLPGSECQAAKSTANRATIVAFSGDMDKLFAALVIATGAAASGMEVSVYFTFWGLTALRRKTVFRGKSILEKLMALMLPSGPDRLGTSRFNFCGAGPAFFRHIMKKKNIQTIPDLIALARESDVRLIACTTSMDAMGITKDELIDGLDFGGVATYLDDAADSKIALFI